MSYRFDNTRTIILPDLGRPIFYRINRQKNKKTPIDDIYWGDATPENRFSINGIKQTYLATNLDSISEATPWRKLSNSFNPSPGFKTLIEASMLDGYFVSLIQPKIGLKLLDLTGEALTYGFDATHNITNGEDKTESKIFSEQCLLNTSLDGIHYPSATNTFGRNVYLYDRCKAKFNKKSVIKRMPLVDAIRPIQVHLEHNLGLQFLI